ncbi:MAG: alginate lyase family protein, partial [Vicinamibacterales bacterium]
CANDDFRRRMLRSLFIHGEFIARNLETSDINGNHYLSDAAGLVAIGAFFAHTPDGQRWLSLGQRIITHEILLQVHPDGVDHEGSTPYHRLVLELFLFSYILLDRTGRTVPPECRERLARMCDFVVAYTKPNGLAPLIGDADNGRVHKLGLQELNDHRYLLSTASVYCRSEKWTGAADHFWDESFWMLGPDGAAAFDALRPQRPSSASAAFPDGGFYVLRNAGSHVIVDCGEVGMRGRGGHGHNDALSFELYMNGMNGITDCGAYVYTGSREWRNRFRSTAFHNTVQVDGEELNRFIEPNALWQLHDDARPSGVRFDLSSTGGYWEGGHTGYRRLPRPVEPRRSMWLHPEQPLLAIRDVVTGEGRHRITWRWHFDPACRVTVEGNVCRILSGDRELWLQFSNISAASMRLDDSWVSPSYGVKHPAAVVVVATDDVMPVRLDYLFSSARLTESQQTAARSALENAAANVK